MASCRLCRATLDDKDVTPKDMERGAGLSCPECGALYTASGIPLEVALMEKESSITAPARPYRRVRTKARARFNSRDHYYPDS